MLESTIEGTEDCGQSRNEDEQRASVNDRLASLTEEARIIRNVLENVHRDDGVCVQRPAMIAEVSLENLHPLV